MINVQYTNSDAAQVAIVEFGAFESSGNAEPTNRLLDGSDDHGFAEEWSEPGHVVIDGERRPAELIFLFCAEEISDADAEDYPWDAEHAARILLRD